MGEAMDVEAQRGSRLGGVEMEAPQAARPDASLKRREGGSQGVRITFKVCRPTLLARRRRLSRASMQREGAGERVAWWAGHAGRPCDHLLGLLE
eukprot:351487-Chlamydomonas_euryale.AAC.5